MPNWTEKPCAADLDPGSASLDFYKSKGKDVQTSGASYSSKGQCSVRFALMNVLGPGKYGKESIQNFALSWNVSKAWNFNKAQDDCTFTFSRLDTSGVDGGVSCSGKGPSIGDFKFNAAPLSLTKKQDHDRNRPTLAGCTGVRM